MQIGGNSSFMNKRDFTVADIVSILLFVFTFGMAGAMSLEYIEQNPVTITIVLASAFLGAVSTGFELVRSNIERLGVKGVIVCGVLLVALNLIYAIFNRY